MSENGLALVGNEELAVNYKALVNEIVGLQDQIEELESRAEKLESENAQAWDFNKTAAISIEQLWKIVREDIQGLPVPDGIDLRSMT